MAAARFTPAAVRDLDGIWDYTVERWGAEQAERYIRGIATACDRLAGCDLPGLDAGDIRAGYRKQLVGRHVVWYRAGSDGGTDVVRILHAAMDPETRLDEA